MNAVTTTAHSHSIRILIADTDADTRSLYEDLLTGAGYEVVAAIDGREALVKALSHPPALVLTETNLAIIDGYSLCACFDAIQRHGASRFSC